MEFWGIEVPAGKSKPVHLGDGQLIHISQAALGFEDVESAKDVVVSVSLANMKKIVLGTLSSNTPQIMLNQVLHRKSFLSHSWKDGSVHFSGYSADEKKLKEKNKQKSMTRLIGDAGGGITVQEEPSQSSPSQLARPPQNAGASGNFGQTQAAGSSEFGGPLGIFGQSNYGQSSVAQKTTVVQQAPALNRFGTLPAIPLMSIGPAGTSPSIQYGVSSLPTHNLSAETVLGKIEPLPQKEAVVGKRKKKTGENQPVEAPEEKTEKKTKKKAVDAGDSVLPEAEAEDADKQGKRKKQCSSAFSVLGKTETLPGKKEEVVGKRKKKTKENQPEDAPEKKKAKKTKKTAVDSDDTVLAEAEAEDAGKQEKKKKKRKRSSAEVDSLDTEAREIGKKMKKRKHAAPVEEPETTTKKKDKQKKESIED